MTTPNEEIRDRMIRHSIWLERYKTGLANRVVEILNKADADLLDQIMRRLQKIDERGYDFGPATTKRLQELQKAIRAQRIAIMVDLGNFTASDLKTLAEYEAGLAARIVAEAVAPVAVLEIAAPSRAALNAIVTSKPFEGRLLKEWYSSLATIDARRINDAISIGITQGQTTDQIVRRIRGTRARKYEDGILAISRRDANSIVRTAVAHVSARAKEEVYAANADVMLGEQFFATLDARTTVGCAALDGKVFPVGKGPMPPRHFNCRSIRVAYLGESSIVGTRASAFGPVPQNTTYEDWLKGQPVAVQNEVLGVKKAQLFRKGDLPLSRFVDGTGKQYTLDDLRQRDGAVWDKVFDE